MSDEVDRSAVPPVVPTMRVVESDGRVSFVAQGLHDDFLHDLYHYLLTSTWPQLLGLLAAVYVVSNAVFGAAYLLQPGCLENARPGSFADTFFFSVQTMATLGYGKMVPVTLYANILASAESFVGLLGLALVTGLVFSKFARPTARVLFSRVAVITVRDGIPSLMFRLANQRRNQIVEARIHVVLARTETTAEGEVIRRLTDLQMVRAENALFLLTWTAIHQITEASPLFGATPESLAATEAEIIVSVTGLDESFAQTVHARHSFVAEEIVWGARFVDILTRHPDGRRAVDYTRFHEVEKRG